MKRIKIFFLLFLFYKISNTQFTIPNEISSNCCAKTGNIKSSPEIHTIIECIKQKLQEIPSNSNSLHHYNKARELARYICSATDMDVELREQFNEIIRGSQSMTLEKILCFQSFLLHLNVTGPLVDTFDENLRELYENDDECKREIDVIREKTVNDDCEGTLRMEVYLKIAIIASGNYTREIKRAERIKYKENLKKSKEIELACVVEKAKKRN
ncbi:hypothetical protein PVAND_014480 [Polypedilum vanderplanki]|uniref:Uncharacterized protein n=1 Tax=Polypedilum vanderplanki TaxID=319348 RepID=A0A9J6B9I2_POLVA|nr:hypothetical protein PVAND_014480 [Polypedilum vanderplanki]